MLNWRNYLELGHEGLFAKASLNFTREANKEPKMKCESDLVKLLERPVESNVILEIRRLLAA